MTFVPALSALWNRWLLLDREKVVATRSAGQAERVRKLWDAADKRSRAAEILVAEGEPASALFVAGQAIVLASSAALLAKHEEASLPTSAATALSASLELEEISKDDRDMLERTRQVFENTDLLHVDSLDEDLQRSVAREGLASAKLVLGVVEPRSARALRVTRALRVAVVVALLVGGVGVLLMRAMKPKNLARGKVATASSLRSTSPPASGLVNGDVEATFGVHTHVEDSPWVMVDLGGVYPVREVRTYPRGDGWEAEQVPVILEFSHDGTTFFEVDRRTEPYSQKNPWIAQPKGKETRFVRLRMRQHGYIAVSELEVYKG